MKKINDKKKVMIQGGYIWNTIYTAAVVTSIGVSFIGNILNIINSTKQRSIKTIEYEKSYLYGSKKLSTNFF